MNLILISKPLFDIELEMAYATTENFCGKALYSSANCYLHPEAAKRLQIAISYAKMLGYRLKIFDGFRPLAVQQIFANLFPNSPYISNPATGSVPHCRGIAIDLTLISADNGEELDMGTSFDDFTSKAWHGAENISDEAKKNRIILAGIMSLAEFDFYSKEWWHYQLFNPRSFEILDKKAESLLISHYE